MTSLEAKSSFRFCLMRFIRSSFAPKGGGAMLKLMITESDPRVVHLWPQQREEIRNGDKRRKS